MVVNQFRRFDLYAVIDFFGLVYSLTGIEMEIVNSCESGNGGCLHHCQHGTLGPVCSCNHGYHLNEDLRTCSGELSFKYWFAYIFALCHSKIRLTTAVRSN